LLAYPACWLLLSPEKLPPLVAEAGSVWGWVALAAAIMAVVWHVGQTLASAGVHVLGGLGVAVAVLSACTAANWDRDNWLAYHVLAGAVVVLGAGALLAGWKASDQGRSGEPSRTSGDTTLAPRTQGERGVWGAARLAAPT